MTAASAVEGIREVDAQGEIGLIGAEPDAPYDRPPLSKKLWKGEPMETIWRSKVRGAAELHLGRTVVSIRRDAKEVRDEQGAVFGYEKLLYATGGRPKRLSFGGDRIIHFRTVADYRRLRALADDEPRFAVIGAGFIGAEIAAALAMNGREVTMIFPSKGVADRTLPAELCAFVSEAYRQKGVRLLPGTKVTALEETDGKLRLQTAAGQKIAVGGVVAGIGIAPNVELAEQAKLTVDGAVVVDELLRTSDPAIYAAGDVAAFHSPALGKRIRVEHEDNANTMGRLAGRNMAGANEPYRHLPFFYSDLFEFGYEAVGEIDSRLTTFADWKDPNREGVIYYLQGGRVRGVLLWNVWGQVDAARKLIAEPGPFGPEMLKGRIR